MSVDPVEGEPAYAYVRGNPTNNIDPYGYQTQDKNENPCDNWSGFLKYYYCVPIENGDLVTNLEFWDMVVIRNRWYENWSVAADFLKHYLYGQGEKKEIYDREWLLSTPQDRQARLDLISKFVDEHLRPALADCYTSPPPIKAHLTKQKIRPPHKYELRNVLGEHIMEAEFSADLYPYSPTIGVQVRFFGEDVYNFDETVMVKMILNTEPLLLDR